MITIFSNPRPFKGIFDGIQRNAIASWLALGNGIEVILFDDEDHTTQDIAKELGISCITDVECNEFGTPLLSSVFKKVKIGAHYPIICQVNADIILTNDFLAGVRHIQSLLGNQFFFMSGRRWDLDFSEVLDTGFPEWQEKIIQQMKVRGVLHGFSGMDYWMFPRSLEFSVPPFVVGRPGMDSWLVYRSRQLGIPVIDATNVITAIHQNHPYPKKGSDSFAIEKNRNVALAGGAINAMTLREADWLLTKNGLARPVFPRAFFARLALCYPWQVLLFLKRKLWQLIGKK